MLVLVVERFSLGAFGVNTMNRTPPIDRTLDFVRQVCGENVAGKQYAKNKEDTFHFAASLEWL
ncbi:hypothetical protein D3C78_1703170 [compost metagenome]